MPGIRSSPSSRNLAIVAACGRHTLAADHVAAAVRLAPDEDRRLAERAVQMRLDDLQREAGGGRRIERVAALFEHAHADGGGEPMGRGDDPERAADLGTGGKAGHFLFPERHTIVTPG